MKFILFTACVLSFLFVERAYSQQNINNLSTKQLTVNGKVEVNSTTLSSKPCPAMTETQRNAISSPANGSCVYNTTSLQLNVYNGTIWKSAGGGISNWETAFNYAVGDVVIQSNKIYQCNTAHTSSVFLTQIANWTQLANDVASSTGVLPLLNGGSNKAATASAGAVVFSDADSFELTSVGTTGQFLRSSGTGSPAFSNATISSKSQEASAVTIEQIEAPGYTLTPTSATASLLETGNLNALINPGFENTTATTGWTTTTLTATSESTTIHSGKKALKLTASASTGNTTQTVTTNIANLVGTQGIASVAVRTALVDVFACAMVDAVEQNCTRVTNDSTYKVIEIPFVFGSVSYGVRVKNTTSATGDIFVDNAYAGIMPLGRMPEVGQAQLLGTLRYAGTTNCNWSVSSATFASFALDTDCPTPTVTGSIQAPATKVPGFTIPSGVGAGNLMIIAKGVFGGVAGAFQAFRLTDGTSNSSLFGSYDGGDLYYGAGGTFYFPRTSPSAQTIQFQANATTAAAAEIRNDVADRQELSFDVWLIPPTSKIYSQGSDDTDWVSCGLTTADFTGFGTVSAIEDRCMRQGSDLLVQMKFTSGTPTATEGRVGLRLMGAQLTSAGTSVIPSIKMTGQMGRSDNTAATYVTLIEPSVTYMTFGNQQAAGGTQAKQQGSTLANASSTITINSRIPIAGWIKNQITGTFANVITAPGISKPKTCYYGFGGASATLASPTVCSTGTCVEVVDTCNSVTPPTFVSAGLYNTLTFANGTFANNSFLNCDCKAWSATTATAIDCRLSFTTGAQSWAANASGGAVFSNIYATQPLAAANTATNSYITVTCEGQAP
jgi:hypothetical protein